MSSMTRFIRATEESPTGFQLVHWYRTNSGHKACEKAAIIPTTEHKRLCLLSKNQELGITENEYQAYMFPQVEAV